MAGPTRLELATSGVTGRRSIQLNYDPGKKLRSKKARSPQNFYFFLVHLVGGTGFEPVTPGL
jgi:hypothetical protein